LLHVASKETIYQEFSGTTARYLSRAEGLASFMKVGLFLEILYLIS
jgi:hypothetical protein